MHTDTPQSLATHLQQSGEQLVFAESCTAGLASARLASVAGISQHLCGSAVVYQIPTKVAWLNIAPALIDQHGYVSEEVAIAMSEGVLDLTSHATIAAAITGDLGPNASPRTDGTAWIAIISRDHRRLTKLVELPATIPDNQAEDGITLRLYRQRAAVELLLQTVIEFLET
ncbi:MAG: CinA family protein [Planctomycetaceae bacterium]|jgi:nicotinamide-nucleotide amidase|nr:CinA family protein [Planctomycetaceae bacterium]MDG2388152.1 CinA family protein [Planctomycetaceae bacterium]